MKIFYFTIYLLSIVFSTNKLFNRFNIKNESLLTNGIYIINSLSNKLYFTIVNKNILLSNQQYNFRLINIYSNSYYIESRSNYKKLVVNENDKVVLLDKTKIIDTKKAQWNIIKYNNKFLIQNEFNKKFIEAIDSNIYCIHNIINNLNYYENEKIFINFTFNFQKLFEEYNFNKKFKKFVEKEPIDIVIKYIDLTDKSLNRTGIKQIYKDIDNQELKYSIRSILTYIPWIRNIFILMPNERVKYFKSIHEISDKIKYIKDIDILGFNSANIFAFTFNLYKLEKFGVSKNFIYMEDDFFIGKSLKKIDFFYYDFKKRKVLPYLVTWHFQIMNKTEIMNRCNEMFKYRDSIHPHSREGWRISICNTEKYFIERYKDILINTNFTHNAIPENIDDLRDIFKEIKNYKYINETLFSKERNIMTLNQPHFVNLYQINIKHKKVHSISYKYIEVEKINKFNFNTPLFVINTGGNHNPSIRQYKLQEKIMKKKFCYKTKYEINNNNIDNNLTIKNFIVFIKIYIVIVFIKSFNYFVVIDF